MSGKKVSQHKVLPDFARRGTFYGLSINIYVFNRLTSEVAPEPRQPDRAVSSAIDSILDDLHSLEDQRTPKSTAKNATDTSMKLTMLLPHLTSIIQMPDG